MPGKVGRSTPGTETISKVIHNNFPCGNNITLIIHSISSPVIIFGLLKIISGLPIPENSVAEPGNHYNF